MPARKRKRDSAKYANGNKSQKQKEKREKRKDKNHQIAGGTFRHRDLNLQQIGFDSYRSYTKSSLWRKIKFFVLCSKGDKCEICGKQYVVIHHNRYSKSDLEGKCLDHLHPMCSKCHTIVHHDDNGEFIRRMKHVRERFYWLKSVFVQIGQKEGSEGESWKR